MATAGHLVGASGEAPSTAASGSHGEPGCREPPPKEVTLRREMHRGRALLAKPRKELRLVIAEVRKGLHPAVAAAFSGIYHGVARMCESSSVCAISARAPPTNGLRMKAAYGSVSSQLQTRATNALSAAGLHWKSGGGRSKHPLNNLSCFGKKSG